MAAKKTNKKQTKTPAKVVLTKTAKTDKKKQIKKTLTLVLSYIAITVIMLLSQYSHILGIAGEFIKNLFLGLFGGVSFFFPFIMVYDFIYYFRQKKKNGSMVKVYSTIVAVFDLSAIYHMISSGKEKMAIDIAVLYKDGIDGSLSGGIVGGFLGELFKYITYGFGLTVLFVLLAALAFIILYEPLLFMARFIKGYYNGLDKPHIEHKEKPKKEKKLRHEEKEEDIHSGGTDFDKLMDVHNSYADDDENIKANEKDVVLPDGLTEAESRIFEEKDRLDKILSRQEFPAVDDISESIESGKGAGKQPVPASEPEERKSYMPENKIIEYKFPSVELLDDIGGDNRKTAKDIGLLKANARRLEEILRSFGVSAEVVNIEKGPAITRYELQPASGVRVTKIMSLQDDIKMNLAATSIRISPIPGKTVIGIEVPNDKVTPVGVKELIKSDKFKNHKSKLAFTVGMDITGNPVVGDIAKMPHVLIAGATGSGKSVCINSLVTSILYKANPNEVKLIMIDPKVVELGVYNGIPHLLIPVVTDPKKAAGALNWAVMEMQNRYKLFAETEVRNIQGYNEFVMSNGEEDKFMPQIVIIIDELADLMMVASKDVENYICRLAQLARAAGIHLVIATQRPSVNVITGLIKANVPSRIAFAVSSQIDSRTILDIVGAEKLLGKGDMLYHPMGESKPIRVQGALVTDKEVERVVNVVKANSTAEYNEDIMEHLENVQTGEDAEKESDAGDADEMLPQAIEVILEANQASTSLLQRRLKLGYARAARIVDQMEARGIVGPSEGSKPRQILITREQFYEMQTRSM